MCGCAYLAQRATFIKLRGKRLDGCFLVMYGNWGSSAKNHSLFAWFSKYRIAQCRHSTLRSLLPQLSVLHTRDVL